ncbi:MAG: hypothetical protein AVDCRST_MAG64-2367, partial [uncultured Phycisphaerae bacterium]
GRRDAQRPGVAVPPDGRAAAGAVPLRAAAQVVGRGPPARGGERPGRAGGDGRVPADGVGGRAGAVPGDAVQLAAGVPRGRAPRAGGPTRPGGAGVGRRGLRGVPGGVRGPVPGRRAAAGRDVLPARPGAGGAGGLAGADAEARAAVPEGAHPPGADPGAGFGRGRL